MRSSGIHHRKPDRLVLVGMVCSWLFCICANLGWAQSGTKNLAGPGGKVVLFHSAESGVNNFKWLKSSFDKVLSTSSVNRFQPFARSTDFESHLARTPDALIMLSSWHFNQLKLSNQWDPVLVGSRKASTFQRHYLVGLRSQFPSGSANFNQSQITNKLLAGAGSIDRNKNLLMAMFAQEKAPQCQMLKVPKDIDALMSVGFGMARFAIATEHVYERLKKVNPSLHGKLIVLASTQSSLRLVVACPKGKAKDYQRFVQQLDNLNGREGGAQCLHLLGLDDFQAITEDHHKLLNVGGTP